MGTNDTDIEVGQINPNPGIKVKIKRDYNFNGGLKAGYGFDNKMGIYVRLGVDVSHIKIDHQDQGTGDLANNINKSQFFTGFVPGIGIFIKPHEKWLVSLEWRTGLYKKKKFSGQGVTVAIRSALDVRPRYDSVMLFAHYAI
ncbi:MAG: outer membrane beta-barrel protein [bacterium]|nr:outer membrane beta-barrel protein [bacterium]